MLDRLQDRLLEAISVAASDAMNIDVDLHSEDIRIECVGKRGVITQIEYDEDCQRFLHNSTTTGLRLVSLRPREPISKVQEPLFI